MKHYLYTYQTLFCMSLISFKRNLLLLICLFVICFCYSLVVEQWLSSSKSLYIFTFFTRRSSQQVSLSVYFGLTFALAICEILVTYFTLFLAISVYFANDITVSQPFFFHKKMCLVTCSCKSKLVL